jgi:hypothetical protein
MVRIVALLNLHTQENKKSTALFFLPCAFVLHDVGCLHRPNGITRPRRQTRRTMTTTNPLQARISTMSTEQILAAVRAIGGGFITVEQNTVRYFLFREYEARKGGRSLDELMDEIGMGE